MKFNLALSLVLIVLLPDVSILPLLVWECFAWIEAYFKLILTPSNIFKNYYTFILSTYLQLVESSVFGLLQNMLK